ncbi:Na/Pi cotransporter family protein [Pseudoflavonifractor phocaeensis]|uniref:Na/Pi cotransporter family protein n=1 Tax=Pseudoflavonifractor phocaeensis TaxID=1870988 RepID=UPI00195602B4|nr:Na/Pi cotransporter family protein [Pseudoflavonifractor phocaeensis]MBM6871043.1 Na/Pi cotransporter family protein [Pseudoflavonifractor phocaeensis]MBM6938925.1 Na/Pi cotransporter family protein [Pseudoflavonifractor phocaeensis]
MQLSDIFMLFGGLALFLYGMQLMSGGLEVAAGDRLKSILERLTSNRFLGMLVGTGITAVIQSSSATTVMVVGFVNAGLMSLSQAVGVIMGANIGTTATGLLIALDIGLIAPIIAFVGVVLMMMKKSQKLNCIGQIIAGLGILFIGMELMSSSMKPLQEYQPFIDLLTHFSTNPLLGILVGAIFTAIIQSSSASIGILQALASTGVIGLGSAVYVLFGQNIGTCITAVLAGLGGNLNAKRTTIIHLMFNVIGAVLFTIICMFTPFVSIIQNLFPGNVVTQIATTHVIFNVVTTAILLPAGNLLAKAACAILPDRAEESGKEHSFADAVRMGSTSIALSELKKQENAMFQMACQNVEMAFDALLDRDNQKLEAVARQEDQIDLDNAEITRCVSHISIREMSETDSDRLNRLLIVCGNIERIGDHAMNMAEYLQQLEKRSLYMDEETTEELVKLRTLSVHALGAIDFNEEGEAEKKRNLSTVAVLEADSDDKNRRYRTAQIKRMRAGKTDPEVSILYSEILTDIERILDHALNIAQALYEK